MSSQIERLRKVNLLPLCYRREISDLVFFFKCFENLYSLNILHYVSFRSSVKPLRSISRLRNNLPLSIRESSSLTTFRNNVHTFFHDKFLLKF